MSEPVESVWHRTMTPPPYLQFVELEAPNWSRPVQSRRQELAAYEADRQRGGPIDPALQERLFARRQRQVQGQLRRQ